MRVLFILPLALFLASCAVVPEKTVNRDEIRQVIRSNIKSFKICYDKALQENKNFSGKVTMQFDIDSNGKATRASALDNTTGNAEMPTCLADTLKSLQFPTSAEAETVRVQYPFIFSTRPRFEGGGSSQ